MTKKPMKLPASVIVARKAKAAQGARVLTPKDIVWWLRTWQPEAIQIRSEHSCPICHKYALVSYNLIEFYRPSNSGQEDCGYFCGWCGFSNAGSRESVDSRLAERIIYRA